MESAWTFPSVYAFSGSFLVMILQFVIIKPTKDKQMVVAKITPTGNQFWDPTQHEHRRGAVSSNLYSASHAIIRQASLQTPEGPRYCYGGILPQIIIVVPNIDPTFYYIGAFDPLG